MNKSEVEAFVRGKNEGSIIDSYGPSELNDQTVWDVWVEDDGIECRFVIENGTQPIYYSEFQQLAKHAHDNFEALKQERDGISASLAAERSARANSEAAAAHARRMDMFRTYIAAFVFVGSAIALIAFIFMQKTNDTMLWYLLGGLIISGSTMFFGVWRQRKPS